MLINIYVFQQNIKFVNSPTNQKLQIQTASPPVSTTTARISVLNQSPTQGLKNISPPILARKRQDPFELDYTPESYVIFLSSNY